MESRILYIFTRTPLHVGAGSSVGAIDQPIQRERHTGFPIIPGSSLKGSLADLWKDSLTRESEGKLVRAKGEAAWLFGSDSAKDEMAAAGALLFSEAKLLAFPVRSAKGSFAWITSPLLLKRAERDGAIKNGVLPDFAPLNKSDDHAYFLPNGPLAIKEEIVLEDYTFKNAIVDITKLAEELSSLVPNDSIWQEIKDRLVVLTDGQMSFFATSACEVAQHVRIDDATGTAATGALFNQENVPSDTLFYSVINVTDSRMKGKNFNDSAFKDKKASNAVDSFSERLHGTKVLQFGGDASTGLGYCSVIIKK